MSLRQGKVPIPFSFSRSKQTMSFLKREKRICFYVYLETIFWWHALLWEHMQDPLLKPLICKTFTTKEKNYTYMSFKEERKEVYYICICIYSFLLTSFFFESTCNTPSWNPVLFKTIHTNVLWDCDILWNIVSPTYHCSVYE